MIIVPAQLESYRSLKDKTIKIVFETNELTPSQVGDIQGALQSFGFVAFKNDVFKQNEKDMIDNIEVDYQETGKTSSQRLRGVLYRWFEREPQGFSSFTTFYEHHMEGLLNHFKAKLD